MKILLVEDSRSIATVMASRLESFGNEVTHAIDGLTALEKFKAASFDVILMDIEMPGMNGFETTTRIRALEGGQAWAWTPIIFLTSSDTATNLVTAIEAGGDDFLAKSIPATVLHAKMKAMARIAALRQRLSLANSKLQEQANRDGLTGLCNRRYMDLQVDSLWDAAVHQRQPFGLLMLDVDNFKKYNDHYGHQDGDDCLRTVAAALAESVEMAYAGGIMPALPDDTGHDRTFAARYGGEEFAIIVPHANEDVMQALAQTILETLRAKAVPHALNEAWGIVTASIGGALLNPASGEVGDVFRQADAALYRAKHAGRNRFELAA